MHIVKNILIIGRVTYQWQSGGNKMNKKISKAFLAIMLCLVTILAVPNVEVEAATPKAKGAKTITVGSSYELEIRLPKKLKQKQVKISKSKSSNEATISVPYGYYNPETGIYTISGEALKTGKAKVSFNLKVKNKTHKYSITITVKKYTNPVKSLKLDKKEFAPKFKKGAVTTSRLQPNKIIKVVPNKGWKLVSIVGRISPDTTPVKVNNNGKLNNNGNEYYLLYITFKNTKTGVTQRLTFC